MVIAFVFGMAFRKQIANDNRTRIIYCTLMGLMLFLIAALRSPTVGNDSGQYARVFKTVSELEWSTILSKYTKETLFFITLKILSYFGSHHVVLFSAVGTLFAIAISLFIYRFSEDPFVSYIMLIPMQFFSFSLTGLRQVIALSIVLLAIPLLFKKSYVKFILLLVLAYFFHNSVVFVIPFLIILKVKNRLTSTLLFIASLITVYIFRKPILAFITDYIYTDYEIYENLSDATTTFIFYVTILLISIFFVTMSPKFLKTGSRFMRERFSNMTMSEDPTENEIFVYGFFESLLSTGVIIQIFIPLQPAIFRVAMYYQIFSIMLIPKAIQKITNPFLNKVVAFAFFGVMLVMYFFFTYYSAGINPYRFFWQD